MMTRQFKTQRTKTINNLRNLYAQIKTDAKKCKYQDIYDAYTNILLEIEIQAKKLKEVK